MILSRLQCIDFGPVVLSGTVKLALVGIQTRNVLVYTVTGFFRLTRRLCMIATRVAEYKFLDLSES